MPSQAIANAQDYEQIKIYSGDYVDCANVNANHIWIEGVGPTMPHFQNKVCGYKGIFVTNGTDTTIDNIEFSNYSISASYGNNAAGIRAQGLNLTVRNCYFHDGQDGILDTPLQANAGTTLIQNSHFAREGADGYEHDMYINHIASFTIENSLVEQAYLGHEVKTRALKSVIQCNEILGGYVSAYQDSYNIDMPNGGEEHVLNNLIAQGPYEQNPIMVEYGAEGLNNPTQSLQMSGNILINDLGSGVFLKFFNLPSTPAQLSDNEFVGAGVAIQTSNAAMVQESNDTTYASRAAAGITQQFPMPSACAGPIGNVALPAN